MKHILAVLAVLALVISPVIAEEAVVAKEEAAKEMTLKGKIAKVDVKDAEGKVTASTFVLATADAKIDLPTKEVKEDMLNADVVVTVKAVEAADKKVTVKEVVKIEKAAAEVAPAAEAPKAPEAK